MHKNEPRLGELITDGERRRDAVHIALAPVTASRSLSPAQPVGFIEEGNLELVGPCEDNIGIVDPFLTGPVDTGDRFWLFLYPNTITDLRHIWSHPAFTRAAHKIGEKLSE